MRMTFILLHPETIVDDENDIYFHMMENSQNFNVFFLIIFITAPAVHFVPVHDRSQRVRWGNDPIRNNGENLPGEDEKARAISFNCCWFRVQLDPDVREERSRTAG